jgi:hypothetical protein
MPAGCFVSPHLFEIMGHPHPLSRGMPAWLVSHGYADPKSPIPDA